MGKGPGKRQWARGLLPDLRLTGAQEEDGRGCDREGGLGEGQQGRGERPSGGGARAQELLQEILQAISFPVWWR